MHASINKKQYFFDLLQGPPCMAIKLQGFETILTFGGSQLFKVLRALKLASPKLFRPKFHPKFFFLCCLTCFDVAIASVPYQSIECDMNSAKWSMEAH